MAYGMQFMGSTLTVNKDGGYIDGGIGLGFAPYTCGYMVPPCACGSRAFTPGSDERLVCTECGDRLRLVEPS